MNEAPRFVEESVKASGPMGGETKTAPASSHEAYRRARRQFEIWAAAFVLLTAAVIYGFFLDTSIRDDPFTKEPGFWQRLTRTQPHPALDDIPVVPIGARGTLTFRPLEMAWIKAPHYPDAEIERPPQAAALPFVSPAWAQSLPEPSDVSPAQTQQAPIQHTPQQAQMPVQSQQSFEPQEDSLFPTPPEASARLTVEQMRMLPFVPHRPAGDRRPRILHAQCLSDQKTCWIGGDDAQPVRKSTDGGATWSAVPNLQGPVPYFFFQDQNLGFVWEGLYPLSTNDGGKTWSPSSSTSYIRLEVSDDLSTYVENLQDSPALGRMIRLTYIIGPSQPPRGYNASVGLMDAEHLWVLATDGVLSSRALKKGVVRP